MLMNENGYHGENNARQKCRAGLKYTYDGLHSSCVVRSAHDGALVRDKFWGDVMNLGLSIWGTPYEHVALVFELKIHSPYEQT